MRKKNRLKIKLERRRFPLQPTHQTSGVVRPTKEGWKTINAARSKYNPVEYKAKGKL